jgi:hypothetical protein
VAPADAVPSRIVAAHDASGIEIGRTARRRRALAMGRCMVFG